MHTTHTHRIWYCAVDIHASLHHASNGQNENHTNQCWKERTEPTTKWSNPNVISNRLIHSNRKCSEICGSLARRKQKRLALRNKHIPVYQCLCVLDFKQMFYFIFSNLFSFSFFIQFNFLSARMCSFLCLLFHRELAKMCDAQVCAFIFCCSFCRFVSFLCFVFIVIEFSSTLSAFCCLFNAFLNLMNWTSPAVHGIYRLIHAFMKSNATNLGLNEFIHLSAIIFPFHALSLAGSLSRSGFSSSSSISSCFSMSSSHI